MFALTEVAATPAPLRSRRRAVFARHAASLILWREGAQGVEVLMGVRGAGHRFMPNRLVFPGGAVDPGDRRMVASAEPDPATLALLARNAGPRLARALVMAAARELEEETGLSFGQPPSVERIGYLCRAVTPPDSPIRFNARFLVAPAEAARGEAHDSRELEHVRFYPVSEAVTLGLMGVTREILLRLAPYLAQDAAARAAGLFVYRRRAWVAERAARMQS